MSFPELLDCVTAIFDKRGFSNYQAFYSNCETFARAIEAEMELHPGVQIVHDTCPGDDPYRLKWPERVRGDVSEWSGHLKGSGVWVASLVKKGIDELRGLAIRELFPLWLACPRLSLVLVLALVAPWVGWVVALVYLSTGCYIHWTEFKRAFRSRIQYAENMYGSKLFLRIGCKVQLLFGIVSTNLAVIQLAYLFSLSVVAWVHNEPVNHCSLIQVLLLTWDNLFKWHEMFGLHFSWLTKTAWKTDIWGLFDSLPMGSEMVNRVMTLVRLSTLLDAVLRVVFLSGRYCVYTAACVVLGLTYFINKDHRDNQLKEKDKEPPMAFLKMEIPKLIAPVLLAVMLLYESESMFQIQTSFELVCFSIHIFCMFCYTLISRMMNAQDSQVALEKAKTDSSTLFQRMEEFSLLDSSMDLSLFDQECLDIMHSSAYLRNTVLPRLNRGMNLAPALSWFHPLLLVFALFVFFPDLNWVILFITLSTWVPATLNLVLVNISARVVMFCRLTTSEREGLKIDHCSLWKFCPDPVFTRGQTIHVCTQCKYAFCKTCHLRMCSREHPFYVVQVKANWSPLDDVAMIRRGAMEQELSLKH